MPTQRGPARLLPLEVLARQKPSLMHLVRPSATNAAAAVTARPSAPPSREWNWPVTSVAAGGTTPMSAHLKEKARARARMQPKDGEKEAEKTGTKAAAEKIMGKEAKDGEAKVGEKEMEAKEEESRDS